MDTFARFPWKIFIICRENARFWDMKFCVSPTKCDLKNSLFLTLIIHFAQKLKLNLMQKTSMTFFSVFCQKKKIHCKMIQKTRILTPKINFNFGLCKMDNESKKTEFFKSNFVGKTQNLMLEKGPFSRYIMRVSQGERASVSVG